MQQQSVESNQQHDNNCTKDKSKLKRPLRPYALPTRAVSYPLRPLVIAGSGATATATAGAAPAVVVATAALPSSGDAVNVAVSMPPRRPRFPDHYQPHVQQQLQGQGINLTEQPTIRRNRYADRLVASSTLERRLQQQKSMQNNQYQYQHKNHHHFHNKGAPNFVQHHFPRVMIVNPMHIVNISEHTKSRLVKFNETVKRFSEKWFSHVLLLVFLASYACLGAYVFLNFEASSELAERALYQESKSRTVDEMLDILLKHHIANMNASLNTITPNSTSSDALLTTTTNNQQQQHSSRSAAREALLAKISEVEQRICRACRAGFTSMSTDSQWTFWGALFYSMTVFTTIGYGHLTPATFSGRMATMIYAIFGIPILLMVLADLGRLLTRIMKFIFTQSRALYTHLWRRKESVRTRKLLARKHSEYIGVARHALYRGAEYMSPINRRLSKFGARIHTFNSHRHNDTKSGRKATDKAETTLNNHDNDCHNDDDDDYKSFDNYATPPQTPSSGNRSKQQSVTVVVGASDNNIGDSQDEQRMQSSPVITTPIKQTKPVSPPKFRKLSSAQAQAMEQGTASCSPVTNEQRIIANTGKLVDDSDTKNKEKKCSSESATLIKEEDGTVEDEDLDDEQVDNDDDDDDKDEDEDEDDELNIPVSFALFLLVAYMMAGAVIFSIWEQWNYFDSLYFVFISMSTIGFGDLVPQHPKRMIGAFIYLLFGLALTSMCVNVVKEKIHASFLRAKMQIGEKIGLDLEHLMADDESQAAAYAVDCSASDFESAIGGGVNSPLGDKNISSMSTSQPTLAALVHENHGKVRHSNDSNNVTATFGHSQSPTLKLAKGGSLRTRRHAKNSAETTAAIAGVASPTNSSSSSMVQGDRQTRSDKKRLSQRKKLAETSKKSSIKLSTKQTEPKHKAKQAVTSPQPSPPLSLAIQDSNSFQTTEPAHVLDRPSSVMQQDLQQSVDQTIPIKLSSQDTKIYNKENECHQANLLQKMKDTNKSVTSDATSYHSAYYLENSGARSEGNSRRNSVSRELGELDSLLYQISKSPDPPERYAPLLGIPVCEISSPHHRRARSVLVRRPPCIIGENGRTNQRPMQPFVRRETSGSLLARPLKMSLSSGLTHLQPSQSRSLATSAATFFATHATAPRQQRQLTSSCTNNSNNSESLFGHLTGSDSPAVAASGTFKLSPV